MPTAAFTEKYIRSLKKGAVRFTVWSDEPGFGMRVTEKGVKSWVFKYRIDGKSRFWTMGRWPRVSLRDALEMMEAGREDVAHGKDPALAHRKAEAEERAALTVASLMNEYIELWAKPRKKSYKEDERMINAYVIPKWGNLRARDIERRHVVELLDATFARGAPIQGNRILSVIRRAFNFAIERDLLKTNPCTRVRPPAPERRKTRALSSDEITLLWAGLGKNMKPVTGWALKVILITGQRPGEVSSMHTDELDPDLQWWTIPEERAKNKKSHRVPITDLARSIIKEAIGTRSSPCFVFASTHKPGQPVSRQSLAAAMRRNCPDIGIDHATPHDLRRTFTTEGGRIGIPREDRKRVLNHTEGDVTAIYDRYEYSKEKRDALEKWAAHILKLTGNGADDES